MNPLVAIIDSVFDSYEEEKAVLAGLHARIDISNPGTTQELLAKVGRADAVLVNLHKIDNTVISGMQNCKVISRYGVGVDNVDLEAAAHKGIWVANVPDYCVEETADHALALLFACGHGIVFKDRLIRRGEWKLEKRFPLSRSSVCRLGIVGYGRIGRALHRKACALGLGQVLVCDPYVDAEAVAAMGGIKTDLRTLLGRADFISLHVPLTAETHHLLSEPEFSLMKPRVVLVNTSRGPVIDEPALTGALKSRPGMSAGLDVYEQEPLPQDSALRTLENVVLTDHTAYYSEQSLSELKSATAANVVETLTSGRPLHPVNMI
jgi:D-3-phosphoglycerate dehydrogenase